MTLNEIVDKRLEASVAPDGDATMFDEVKHRPEISWRAILELLIKPLSDQQISLLAAGPLEDLLVMHGPVFIDRVEIEAKQNSSFRDLLGGVWESDIDPDVWKRVKELRVEQW